MSENSITVDGKSLFQCPRCDRVPVLDQIEADDQHDDLDDATNSEGMLHPKYTGTHNFGTIEFNDDLDARYEVCGTCRKQLEWFLQPEAADAMSIPETINGNETY